MELLTVMYHFVTNGGKDRFRGLKGITSDVLEEQLERLITWGKPLTIGDINSYLDGSKTIPAKSFYLTFDDGLIDHYRCVFPLLKKYGLYASFFPVTKPLIEGRIPAVEKQRFLQYCFTDSYREFLMDFFDEIGMHDPQLRKRLPSPTVANIRGFSTYLSDCDFYTNDERFYRKIRNEMISERLFNQVVDSLFKKYVPSERSFIRKVYLSKAQLIKMSRQGMDIGVHTHSHPYLPRISKADQATEIQVPLRYLSSFLKSPISSFAYPYGEQGRVTYELLCRLGFRCAFKTGNKISLRRPDRFRIPRVDAARLDQFVAA